MSLVVNRMELRQARGLQQRVVPVGAMYHSCDVLPYTVLQNRK